jgi:stage III sporulation protein AG
MKELIKSIRDKKLSKKSLVLLIGAIVIGIALVIGEITPESKATPEDNTVYAQDDIKQTEKNLQKLLSGIEGAGNVKVMLTVDSCFENVYAKSYDTKSQKTENGTENELSEEYIIVKNGSNNEECLVIKVFEPTVKGVAVIAEGADSIRVKTAITDTVCALFDISTAQVSVEKMNSKNH